MKPIRGYRGKKEMDYLGKETVRNRIKFRVPDLEALSPNLLTDSIRVDTIYKYEYVDKTI